MIAMVDDENSCHSSSSRKSGERYLSFSIIIIIDPSLTPLLHSPPVEECTRLSTQTYVLQKKNFTSLFMNEGKTKNFWQGRWLFSRHLLWPGEGLG